MLPSNEKLKKLPCGACKAGGRRSPLPGSGPWGWGLGQGSQGQGQQGSMDKATRATGGLDAGARGHGSPHGAAAPSLVVAPWLGQVVALATRVEPGRGCSWEGQGPAAWREHTPQGRPG